METAKAMVRMLAEGFIIDKPPNPWATLGVWASIALGIPLAVLVLGSCLVWAFSGFAARRT
jgi:cytochrome c-type biogenesis protein CcmH/NrfF